VTRLHVRPAAEADADLAADYYAREANIDVALRFLAAVDRAYERLREHPYLGTEVKFFRARLLGLRFWPVPGFERYLVFYVPASDLVDIVRVLHGARELRELLGLRDE